MLQYFHQIKFSLKLDLIFTSPSYESKEGGVLVKQVMGNSLKGYEDDFNGSTIDFLKEDASGPISPCNIAKEGIDWEVLGGRLFYRFGECKKSFAIKWFLCKHVDKDHFLIILVGRSGSSSAHEEGIKN
jgi:DNA modification methylase